MSIRRIGALLAASALTITLAACSSDTTDKGGDAASDGPVKIGVVGTSDPQWVVFEEKATEAGIDIELVNFTDYPSINPALSDGTLDLNQFQHILYLAQYNESTGDDLVIIGDTAIFPMGVYSEKYTDVADIPEGAEITIPNDPTNQGRALLLLEAAGLLVLKEDASPVPAPTDIDTDASRVKVTPVDANNVVTAIGSVDATVVNNDYLQDAGLKFSDAIYLESAYQEGAQPYINIWVSRAEDKDNETYLKLVEIFDTQEVKDALQENSDGSAIFADLDVTKLNEILAAQQEIIAGAGA